MKKKILALALIAMMSVTALAGCGSTPAATPETKEVADPAAPDADPAAPDADPAAPDADPAAPDADPVAE